MYTLKEIYQGKEKVILTNESYANCMNKKIKIICSGDNKGILIIHRIIEQSKKSLICPILKNAIQVKNIFENKYKEEVFIENANIKERSILFNVYFSAAKFTLVDNINNFYFN